MAKMTKTQAAKRLSESASKLENVYLATTKSPALHSITPKDRALLLKMSFDIQRIRERLMNRR